MSRREYAERYGVSTQAIDKAVRVGTVILNRDGSVDVEMSDAIWARRRAVRLSDTDPEPQQPVDLAAELRLLAHEDEPK